MNEIIAECVMRQIDQGYNSRRAFELCAEELKGRPTDDEIGESESDPYARGM